MIELRHLEKKFGNSTILRDVSTIINDGDIISIIGPSGTGKSTLLRCINMLERPTGGQILLDGTDITAPKYDLTLARRRMGMVFQSFNLFEHLTVIENLMMAPQDLLGMPKQEAYDKAVKLLGQVGLSSRELRYPDQLSGGQKQRVAIARTLMMDPDVILFDEPTSALDPAMTKEVQAVIKDLAGTGRTMLIVTHEMSFARAICNRVFYMDQGGIYEDGTPEQIFDDPQKELTRRFIRGLKVLLLFIEDDKFDYLSMDSEIDEFCMKNAIPARIKYRIRLAIEEIVQQLLLPHGGVYPVKVTIEYASDEDDKTTVTVSYSGERLEPTTGENILSYEMLEKSLQDIRYTYDEHAELPNTVTMLI